MKHSTASPRSLTILHISILFLSCYFLCLVSSRLGFVKHTQIRDSQKIGPLLSAAEWELFRNFNSIIIRYWDAITTDYCQEIEWLWLQLSLVWALRRLGTVGKISHEKTRSKQLWSDLKEMVGSKPRAGRAGDMISESLHGVLVVSGSLPPLLSPPSPHPSALTTMDMPRVQSCLNETEVLVVNIVTASGRQSSVASIILMWAGQR